MLLGLTLCVAAPGWSQSLLVPEDINRREALSDPTFSPDGERIVYTLSAADVARDTTTSHLWMNSWSAGGSRALTPASGVSEWKPRCSHDGAWLYFLSDAPPDNAGGHAANTGAQLWRMPGNGGPATRVSDVPGGIIDYDLSPDGTRAVIVAYEGGTAPTGAVRPPIVIDRFAFTRDGPGYLGDRVMQLFIVDLATQSMRALTRGARDHWQPAWSPDGRWIAYTGKDIEGRADWSYNYDIFVSPAGGGEARRISTSLSADNDPDNGAGVQWSPDSRHLVWLESGEAKYIWYSTAQLAVADIVTGAITRPARIDRWFHAPRWSADGKSILALIEDDRDNQLAAIDVASSRITYLTQRPSVADDFAVAPNGRIAVLVGRNHTLPELETVEATPRRLTDHNRWLSERKLGDVRDISFKSADGTHIWALMTLPPDFQPGRRYPVLFDLHGGPVMQFAHALRLTEQIEAAAGYVVVGVNSRGSSGRGFEFVKPIIGDPGHVDGQDISAAISFLVETGIADPHRIGVGGWSYGGILTDYMIAQDSRIRAAISGAGTVNGLALWGMDQYTRETTIEMGTPWSNLTGYLKVAAPFFHPERIKAATLFECGGLDNTVPCAGGQQLYLALKVVGTPTQFVVYPDDHHDFVIPSYILDRVRRDIAWFNRWMPAP